MAVPLAVALPRKTAVLTSLDAYDVSTSGGAAFPSATPLPSEEAGSSGWRTVGHVLLASLVGVPVGLMAGEWSWRERPHTLAKKLEENKQAFLKMVKTPLSEKQLQNIGQIGGLASTYNELVAKYKNQDSLQLELPNVSGDSGQFVKNIVRLFAHWDSQAFDLHRMEQSIETHHSQKQVFGLFGDGSLQNTLIMKEEAPVGWFNWLRISEKELMSIDILGQLSQAARQSKWVAGGVAGGIIGAGMLLLTLWHPKSNKATPVLPPASASDGKEVESDPLPTEPLLPSEITTEAGSIQTVEERPTTETVQAFWEKQRKH